MPKNSLNGIPSGMTTPFRSSPHSYAEQIDTHASAYPSAQNVASGYGPKRPRQDESTEDMDDLDVDSQKDNAGKAKASVLLILIWTRLSLTHFDTFVLRPGACARCKNLKVTIFISSP
jgi:hypothetical protein